jgi:surface antigen
MKRLFSGLLAGLLAASAATAHAGQVYGTYGQGGYRDPDAPYQGGGQPGYTPPPAYGQYPAADGGYTGCEPDRDAEVVGTIVGGIVGGIIGNQFGRGRGRTGATVAGVILGGIAGNAITRDRWCRDSRADAYYYNEAYYDAFDTPSYGRRYQWRNQYSGNYGYIEPVSEVDWNGYEDCREFTQTIYINGRPHVGHGVACREPDGSWRIVGQ